MYTIKFWVFHPNYRANATVFIGKADYAIHKLEYTMYDDKKWNKERKKNKHGHKQKAIFDITTNYTRIQDKMYLNYISFHNNFMLNIPPAFKIDYTTVDLKRLCFVVEYNNVPMAKPSIHIPNYDVQFQNKRVRIKTAQRLENKVFLYPMLEEEKVKEMFFEIVAAEKEGKNLNDLLQIRVDNVRDTLGNLVNKWSQKEYLQFREFFTQRIKPDSRAPFDGQFMDKEKPIFEDQPMVKPKDYREYWMNTPLKSI